MQHLKYHDRVVIEYEISENPDSTLRSVADKLGVSRSTIMREIVRNSTVTKFKAISLSFRGPKAPEQPCPTLRKWPYCSCGCIIPAMKEKSGYRRLLARDRRRDAGNSSTGPTRGGRSSNGKKTRMTRGGAS